MTRPPHRSLVVRTAVLALGLPALAAAQDADRSNVRPQPELGLGITTRVPAIADAGFGPVATLQLRRPAAQRSGGWVLGLSYALVPLTRRLPDGSANNSASWGAYATLGTEWRTGDRARMDLQWNPALSGVMRWGTQPSWRGSVPRQRALAAASLGLRWGDETDRVGYAVRLHASLNPMAFIGSVYPTFQVMLRR